MKNNPCARYVLAFAVAIVTWAVLHDVYLIGIEPRHFTEFHRPLLPLQNHFLLALQYAVVASLGPGLLFGFIAWSAACRGSRTGCPLGWALGGFILVLLAVELILRGIGHEASLRYGRNQPPIYPEAFYPEQSQGIVYTQTVNISAYLLAPSGGLAYLGFMFLLRKKAAPRPAP